MDAQTQPTIIPIWLSHFDLLMPEPRAHPRFIPRLLSPRLLSLSHSFSFSSFWPFKSSSLSPSPSPSHSTSSSSSPFPSPSSSPPPATTSKPHYIYPDVTFGAPITLSPSLLARLERYRATRQPRLPSLTLAPTTHTASPTAPRPHPLNPDDRKYANANAPAPAPAPATTSEEEEEDVLALRRDITAELQLALDTLGRGRRRATSGT